MLVYCGCGGHDTWTMLKRIKAFLNRRGNVPADPESPNERHVEVTDEVRPEVHHGPQVVHRPIDECDLDRDAVKIVHRLTRFDHSAYFVGGCVRDLLLDRHPKDFDIGTSATPRQIKQLFRNCRIIGRRFRLAHIYFQNGKIIEVATFRAQEGDDVAIADGDSGDLLIRDDNQFGTMEEDALRRDFTINSLFYDVENGNVLDHADGLGDLRRGLVRTIGDPRVRFQEDPIRILRAIRFAARLNFEIERRTMEALRATRHDIPRAAAPRILEEINRFCRGGAARRSFELLRECGVLEVILPELAKAYAANAPAWTLLLRLLETIDRRFANGSPTQTGQILVVLLLPLLEQRIGWAGNGKGGALRDAEVRELVDELLRPLALRLRLARKDQEHCRVVISLLARMARFRSLRRNSRRAILRRACLPDAVWVLESAASLRGGELTEAATHWKRSGVPARSGPDGDGGAKHEEPKRRRRSRRGRGRGRGGGAQADHRTDDDGRRRSEEDETETAEGESRRLSARGSTPASQRGDPPSRRRRRGGKHERRSSSREEPPRPEEDSKLPPVWDDDYFFAALPSVPEMAGDEKIPRRYGEVASAETHSTAGTTEVGPDGATAESDAAPSDEPESEGPRRRRRRRRKTGRRVESEGTETKPTGRE